MTSVRLWLVDLAGGALDHVALSKAELAVAGRKLVGSLEWMRSRRALRCILGRELGVAAEDVAFEVGPKGKPRAQGVEFSLSHSGQYALIGVSDVSIGVDVERVRPEVDYRSIGPRFLGQDPRDLADFFRVWTMQEAYVKAIGEGISGQLHTPPAEGHCSASIPGPRGYAAAVAVLAPALTYSFEKL